MEKFWAAILIFVVVAAAGLMYVNQVYNPQKDSQAAMAETANQTLSAVKSEMGEDTSSKVVGADDVIHEVETRCNSGNTVAITVITATKTENYLAEYSALAAQMQGIIEQFLKVPQKNASGELVSIKFSIIN